MDERNLGKAYRNAWLLVAFFSIFLVLLFVFALGTNEPAKSERWDMGARHFVPASGPEATGYHLPVEGSK